MVHRSNSPWLPAMTKVLAVALLSVHTCLAQSSTPQLLQVDWQFDVKPPLNATVGDTIQFTWSTSSYHDVFIHPSGNCDNVTGAIPVYPYATIGGSVNYTFTADDAAPGGKPVFFACEVGDGIHCHFNVNQMVIVYPGETPPTFSPTMVSVTTPPPTATPTVNALPMTIAPSSAPPQSSAPSSIIPSMVPTASINGTTASPTVSSASVTTAPSTANATSFPTALPITTMAPSIPDVSLAPTVGTSPAPSAVIMLSMAPSLQPSISKAPTSSPSNAPTGMPSIATPSPTTSVMTTVLQGLEMTLYGTRTMSQADITAWESVTSLYQTSFYADGSSGVLDLETNLTVISTKRRRRRRLQDSSSSTGDSVTLVYSQNMTYRLSDDELTPAIIVSTPFSTEESRSEYVNLYLNNVGDTSALTNVTSVSPIEGDAVVVGNSTAPPTNNEEEQLKKNNGGLSGGAIAGIVVASLVACVVCCLVTAQRHERENEWDEEEENPYIPPSPASFENYAASNKSVEHAFFQD